MKKIFLLISILACNYLSFAQQTTFDNLIKIIQTSKDDSVKIHTVLKIPFGAFNGDSVFYYSKKIIDIGVAQKNADLLAMGWCNLGYSFYKTDNLSKSLESNLTALKLAEKHNNPLVLAMVYENLGLCLSKNNPEKAEYYFLKGIDIINHNKPINFYAVVYGNYARLLIKINRLEEALNVIQKFALFQRKLNLQPENNSWYNELLFDANTRLNQPEVAIGYGRTALKYVYLNDYEYPKCRLLSSFGKYFYQNKMYDSSYHYFLQAYLFANKNKLLSISVEAADGLSQYHLIKANKDSSIYYLQVWRQLNDSLMKVNKASEIQTLSFEEQLREKEVELSLQEEKESRNYNLQLAITAIAILSAIILFLLLSRSILVSHKVVEFLSVLVLLVVFEFINLLIHPFLESITHHSPVLMLLALVAIASLIIPLHHRLEHWTTKILVEKNKAIRLANAKKTIEELGDS